MCAVCFFRRDKKEPPRFSGGQVLERRLAFLEETVKTRQVTRLGGFFRFRVMLQCSIGLTYLYVNK